MFVDRRAASQLDVRCLPGCRPYSGQSCRGARRAGTCSDSLPSDRATAHLAPAVRPRPAGRLSTTSSPSSAPAKHAGCRALYPPAQLREATWVPTCAGAPAAASQGCTAAAGRMAASGSPGPGPWQAPRSRPPAGWTTRPACWAQRARAHATRSVRSGRGPSQCGACSCARTTRPSASTCPGCRAQRARARPCTVSHCAALGSSSWAGLGLACTAGGWWACMLSAASLQGSARALRTGCTLVRSHACMHRAAGPLRDASCVIVSAGAAAVPGVMPDPGCRTRGAHVRVSCPRTQAPSMSMQVGIARWRLRQHAERRGAQALRRMRSCCSTLRPAGRTLHWPPPR